MRIKVKLQDGQIGTIEDNEFDPQTMQRLDAQMPQTPQLQQAQQPQIQPQVQPQNESFVGNVGRDIGENVQGLLSLPGLLKNIITGKVNAGDVGSKMATGIVDEYKNLIAKPGETLYKKPVSSVLNVLPFLQLGKVAMAGKFSKAGTAAKTVGVAEKAAPMADDISRILSKSKTVTVPKTTMAGKMFSENFTVPRKIAYRLKPIETSKQILDYKIPASSIDDYVRIAGQISGDRGMLTNINRTALKYAPEVNVEAIMPSVGNFVKTQATLKGGAKTTLKEIRDYLPRGGRKIGFANAEDLFDSMKQLESQGHQLINASTDLTPNLKSEQLGKSYLAAADEIETALNQAVGGANILDNFKTPEVIGELSKISPKLAGEFQRAKTYSDIRGLQKPFVRLQRMAEVTQNSQISPFNKLAEAATRGQGLGILNQVPILNTVLGRATESAGKWANIQGAQALTNAAPVTNLISKILGAAKGAVSSTIKQPSAYIAGRQVPQMSAGPQGEIPQPEDMQREIPQPEDMQEAPQGMDMNKIQKALVLFMIQDMANGGKNISKIQALSAQMSKLQEAKSKEDKDVFIDKAITNIDAINKMDKLGYAEAGRAAQLSLQALGGRGVSDSIVELNQRYELLKLNILRAYQGARISDADYKLSIKYTPQISDTNNVAKEKLRVLKEILGGSVPPTGAPEQSMPLAAP